MKTEPRVVLVANTVIAGNIPGYIDHPPSMDLTNADDLAEQAGRLCYESWGRKNPATSSNGGYLDNILHQGHYSVLEHSGATFYVDGVTRNFTHELIRHRHLSYSEVSQRYCDVGLFDFVEHPGLATIGEAARNDLLAAIEAGRKAYASILSDLESQGQERKQARQAARHALVSGTETKILITGNLRAWRDTLAKRLATKEDGTPLADLEFFEVAKLILAQLKMVAPNSFQDFIVN